MRRRFLLSVASLVTLAATTPKGANAAEQTGCYENGSLCKLGSDCCSRICVDQTLGSTICKAA